MENPVSENMLIVVNILWCKLFREGFGLQVHTLWSFSVGFAAGKIEECFYLALLFVCSLRKSGRNRTWLRSATRTPRPPGGARTARKLVSVGAEKILGLCR